MKYKLDILRCIDGNPESYQEKGNMQYSDVLRFGVREVLIQRWLLLMP